MRIWWSVDVTTSSNPAAGSRVSGKLIESVDHRKAIDVALDSEAIDLIHFHGLDFHQYLSQTNVPMLATLHLPVFGLS
jgi:hypothetical protein